VSVACLRPAQYRHGQRRRRHRLQAALNRRTAGDKEDERVKRVLVTGCSSGIGRALAAELARRGHQGVATRRRLASIADLTVAQQLSLDVGDSASVEEAVRQAGEIDILVN